VSQTRTTEVRSAAWSWKSSGGIALAVVLVAVGVGGFLLRLWLLGNAPLNSDEATAGLIAHQVLHGHTYAFFWGQSYGGVEPYVLALTFSLFGQSPFVLNATPALLALVGSVLVWRIGLRLFVAPAAVLAAVLSWVWSESSVWNSVREYGFHEVCMTLGLVVLFQAVRITQSMVGQEVGRTADWVVFGAAGGLGEGEGGGEEGGLFFAGEEEAGAVEGGRGVGFWAGVGGKGGCGWELRCVELDGRRAAVCVYGGGWRGAVVAGGWGDLLAALV